ncbi:MAG: ABC transporter ATP-binding protein, partial [Planctomycetota bacterium]
AAERRAAEAPKEARRAEPSAKAAKPPEVARPKRLSNWEERELEALPEKIEAAEGELTALDAKLADPSIYAGDSSRAQALTAERAALQEKVDALLSRWEELESRA